MGGTAITFCGVRGVGSPQVSHADMSIVDTYDMLGVTASAAAAEVNRFREPAFVEVGALPLCEQFARSCAAFPRGNRTRTH